MLHEKQVVMGQMRVVKRIFDSKLEGRRKMGRLRMRELEYVETIYESRK
jgi:hypothetical protein